MENWGRKQLSIPFSLTTFPKHVFWIKQPSKGGVFCYLPAFVYQFSGNPAPSLGSILSLLLVFPRLFFYYNQACNIFARSIFLKYKPGDISSPLKKALLMVTLLHNTLESFYLRDSSHLFNVVFLSCYMEDDKYMAHSSSCTLQAQVFIQQLLVESLPGAWTLFSSRKIISIWFLTSQSSWLSGEDRQ